MPDGISGEVGSHDQAIAQLAVAQTDLARAGASVLLVFAYTAKAYDTVRKYGIEGDVARDLMITREKVRLVSNRLMHASDEINTLMGEFGQQMEGDG
jgi:hypothetical protein